MAKKFIPNGDGDFRRMAENFARNVGAEPGRFGVTADDAAALDAAVRAFTVAYERHCRPSERSAGTTAGKEEARRAAEMTIRRLAAGMRVNRRFTCRTA